ncbi:MAG: hypothetical protein COT73_08310 [Bdellovibrio sp. CG10_big_fil_rev_8_21_14_0_10_47_8]|nr:MAG: hypothetical protein COT73_08310 [Bdellovibrio sp. CG10_big_fil_rev_8_21_14_0_10_47_8]
MKVTKILVLGFVFITMGCQTIRMKYESTVTAEDGTRDQFLYENSYPVGGAHPTLCAITGILLGGSCWYYLVMPTVQQKQAILEDAETVLNKKMAGKKYDEAKVRVSRVSFSEGEEEFELRPKNRKTSDQTR